MKVNSSLRIILGSVLVAVVAYVILAAPGMLTELASTVSMQQLVATVRP